MLWPENIFYDVHRSSESHSPKKREQQTHVRCVQSSMLIFRPTDGSWCYHKSQILISFFIKPMENHTKSSNASFERSNSGHLQSWELGTWHWNWPAMPPLCISVLFRRRWCGKLLMLPRPFPPGIWMSTMRTGIVCPTASGACHVLFF